MRQNVHNQAVQFRINDRVLAAAEERAKEQGMSLSELIRAAVRREVKEAA